jgi:hypothetical protein
MKPEVAPDPFTDFLIYEGKYTNFLLSVCRALLAVILLSCAGLCTLLANLRTNLTDIDGPEMQWTGNGTDWNLLEPILRAYASDNLIRYCTTNKSLFAIVLNLQVNFCVSMKKSIERF